MRPTSHSGDDETIGGACSPHEADRRRVTDAFVTAAAADPRQLPATLCRACVELLPVTSASVSIVGSRTVSALWCASDRTAARLAEAQYTVGDGPCQSAIELVAPVLAPDLTRGPDARRWPVFAQQAVELGVRAVFSLPLGTSAQAIGTLDLYRDTTGELSERDLRIALLARDAVTFAVLNLQIAPDSRDQAAGTGVASWVEAAEADHMEVHQAIGMVMVQLGVDPEQALDRMRAYAFVQGRTVTEVSQDVLARTVRFHPDTKPNHAAEDHGRPSGNEEDGDRS
ncbi:GAF and ANTAR domain-containing protein [Streptomyces sp. NPDC057654]|uniref:GAF and ANTAR domain-containing protein n=1 Tax=Streptomyces sp. NPDC057654 TaxID=3346196 RepID=UPI00367AA230